jgi:hypothetical protein
MKMKKKKNKRSRKSIPSSVIRVSFLFVILPFSLISVSDTIYEAVHESSLIVAMSYSA